MKFIENLTVIVVINQVNADKSEETPEKKMRGDLAAPHRFNSYLHSIAPLVHPRLLRYLLLGAVIASIAYLHPSLSEIGRWLLERVVDGFTDYFIGKGIESLFR